MTSVTYKVETTLMAKRLALAGYDNQGIATAIGISLAQFLEWTVDYPELAAALNDGRHGAIGAVSEALFIAATVGTKVPAVRHVRMGKAGEDYIETINYTDHRHPDVTAMVTFLTNRAKEHWRHRQEITGPDGRDLIPPQLVITPVIKGDGS